MAFEEGKRTMEGRALDRSPDEPVFAKIATEMKPELVDADCAGNGCRNCCGQGHPSSMRKHATGQGEGFAFHSRANENRENTETPNQIFQRGAPARGRITAMNDAMERSFGFGILRQ
jgi:hypothetical protein